MDEIKSEPEPSLWQQIPTSVKVGASVMSIGGIGEMIATAKCMTETMYVNLANVLVVGKEIPPGIHDSTRNLMLGSLAVGFAGCVTFFKGVREGLEQQD